MDETGRLFFYEKNLLKGEVRIPSGEILQVAELAISEGSEIRGHKQICDEITYGISGSATVYSGDNVFTLSAGQIHYIRKGEYHRIVADRGENFRYCCLGFAADEQYSQISCFVEAVQDCGDFLVKDGGSIKTLFPLLVDEFYIQDQESYTMIHFYFCQILIQLYRLLCGTSREKMSRLNTSASNMAVCQALRYIDREYPRLTQTRQVAQALSYSEYYLCHIFRESMGMTLKEYLMQKKIKTATELLESSSMTISEIAEQLSFSSPHTFSIAFKRYTELSPSQYRERFKVGAEDINK